jgi:hypothetical protein
MRYLKWIGAVAVFVVGMMFASSARRNKQRAETITEREIAELSKGKKANLKKAAKLGAKTEVLLGKSKKAKEAAEQRVKTLENSNATTLADRAREFNDRL